MMNLGKFGLNARSFCCTEPVSYKALKYCPECNDLLIPFVFHFMSLHLDLNLELNILFRGFPCLKRFPMLR